MVDVPSAPQATHGWFSPMAEGGGQQRHPPPSRGGAGRGRGHRQRGGGRDKSRPAGGGGGGGAGPNSPAAGVTAVTIGADGTSIPQVQTSYPPGTPTASVSPPTLTYLSQPQSTLSPPQTVTVTDTGT